MDEIGDDAKDVLLNLEEKKLLNVLQAYRLTGDKILTKWLSIHVIWFDSSSHY